MKELDSILKSIKNKAFLPVYFLHGEEPYYIDVAVKSFENDVLEEDEKAFGQTVVYGKDTNIPEIISLAQQFPMFGNYNLIIVKEAQDLKFGEDECKILESYIENPVPTTILVFAHKHKKVDSRKKFAKTLQKNGQLFLSEPVKDWNLAKWIADECTALDIKTAPNISHLLAEYLGNDLSRIANELSKLKMILKDGEMLDEKLVEMHIGISKDFNNFELRKAFAERNREKTMKIAFYMGKNDKVNPFPAAVSMLYNFFSNLVMAQATSTKDTRTIQSSLGMNYYEAQDVVVAMRNYSLKNSTRIISILREMDLKSKGLGAGKMDTAELYRELIYKIINIDQLKVKT